MAAVPWRALRGAAAAAVAALGDEEGDTSSEATAEDMSLSQVSASAWMSAHGTSELGHGASQRLQLCT
jgi:hypothetical protein